MGHMGQGHDIRGSGLESLSSWRLHEWDQRAFCVAPDVHSRERLIYRDHLAPVPDLARTAVDQNEVIVPVASPGVRTESSWEAPKGILPLACAASAHSTQCR